MSEVKGGSPGFTRRDFVRAGAAALTGSVLGRYAKGSTQDVTPRTADPFPGQDVSHIYHAVNGTPAANVAKVFEMAYGGIEHFIGQDDIVLLRPNLQWPRNGYTNSDIGFALIDLILRRPGGFTGEIIVIEDQHKPDPHTRERSGWCTTDKISNGPYNWFELIQHFIDHADGYPSGMHTDPATGQINVSFQFLMSSYDFTLAMPHPVLSTYGGARFAGASAMMAGDVDPFLLFKTDHPAETCLYVRRTDLRYSEDIARVGSLKNEYLMNYPVFKSPHSDLYVSLYRGHPTAWDPETEHFTSQRVKLINMATLNHHQTAGQYAGVTSVVKGHFGMIDGPFHGTGWDDEHPATFYYAGGAIGYWMATIRRADLHMSCAERIGLTSRTEDDAFSARSVVVSTDPLALDYYVGREILFPAGGPYGLGGEEATEAWSNDPGLAGGYYALTLEFCRDPLADHSVINGTTDEAQMLLHRHDFDPRSGDFDQDGDVDGEDYAHFQACHGGPSYAPVEPACGDADLDRDLDVDLADWARFERNFGDGT